MSQGFRGAGVEYGLFVYLGMQLDFGGYLHQEAPRHEKLVVVKEAPEPVPETFRYVVCSVDSGLLGAEFPLVSFLEGEGGRRGEGQNLGLFHIKKTGAAILQSTWSHCFPHASSNVNNAQGIGERLLQQVKFVATRRCSVCQRVFVWNTIFLTAPCQTAGQEVVVVSSVQWGSQLSPFSRQASCLISDSSKDESKH